jgi:hypothetical protein
MDKKNQETKQRRHSKQLCKRLESANCQAIDKGMPAQQILAINSYHLMELAQHLTGGTAAVGATVALDVMAGYLKDRYQPESLKTEDELSEITIQSKFFFTDNSNLEIACLLRALAEHITQLPERPTVQSLTPRNCLH